MKLESAIKQHMALTALVLIVIAIISYIGVVWWSFEAYRAYKDRTLSKYPESIRPWMDIFYDSTIYGRIAGYATAALLFVIGAIMIVFSCMSILNAHKTRGDPRSKQRE
jgi:di/tricarboxylate transporter